MAHRLIVRLFWPLIALVVTLSLASMAYADGLGSSTFTAPLAVPFGGTGQTSLPAHALLIGNGGSGVNSAVMAAGQCLVSQVGADPLPSTCPGGGAAQIPLTYGASYQGDGGMCGSSSGIYLTVNALTTLCQYDWQHQPTLTPGVYKVEASWGAYFDSCNLNCQNNGIGLWGYAGAYGNPAWPGIASANCHFASSTTYAVCHVVALANTVNLGAPTIPTLAVEANNSHAIISGAVFTWEKIG